MESILSLVGGGILITAAVVLALGVAVVGMLAAFAMRRVVPTNEVHIVQSARTTISYGKDMEAGNTYYAFPSWVPKLGVSIVKLPVSVFDCNLDAYDAYDQGRVPFVLDIKAFFRIDNSNLAAQRVSSFDELIEQLRAILQGAVRTILSSEDIETILSGRSTFGEKVTDQLKAWGVTTVKTIELMDIRDAKDSEVIANIMEKKKSLIEKESRVAVAENLRVAKIAEITAQREVELSQQEAAQQVGIRKAQVEREVGIAHEQSVQAIKEQARETAARDAEVKRVQEVKAAEIARDKAVVQAEQQAKTTVVVAEGDLKSTELAANGVKLTGAAKAEAEKLMQLAPVEAQIVLAKEIGGNEGYQTYLVTLEQVKASQVVGVAQADALRAAGIKVIATGGSVQDGVSSVGQLFTPQGGLKLGTMLESFSNTDTGRAVMKALGAAPPSDPVPASPVATLDPVPAVEVKKAPPRKSSLDTRSQ